MPAIADPQRVRTIEVIAINAEADSDFGGWRSVPGKVIGTWSDAPAREVLGLVAALPEAERMRCFTPRYAIRLHGEAGVLTEVAFCFRCHVALRLPTPGGSDEAASWFTFDPDSEPGRELLRRFRAVAGSGR